MTREEHIENLKAIASDMPSDKCSDWIESLMAGVKALEQEPCEDCISRFEAIESIKHAQLNFSVKSEIDFTKHKREVQEIADGMLNAQIKALGGLPSVRPKAEQEPTKTGHWINLYSDNYKCSECGDWWKGEEIKECNYCPHCGSYNGGGRNEQRA